MAHYRNTQNFTPRQDIAVATKAITDAEKPSTEAIPFGKSTNINRKLNLLSLTRQRFHPILAIVLIWLIIPALRNQKRKSHERYTTNVKENFNNPETIVNMLSDVSPYLDLHEQENIQTLIGIFEAVNILNNIKAGTYQSPRILKNISLSTNPQDRKLGIIKAIKPYLPSNNHEVIDKAIHTYNTVNKVSKSLVNYNSKNSGNAQTQNNIDRITEMFDVIAPIVPYKQRQMLNQIRKMIKMYTIMESSMESNQLWDEWTQQGEKQAETQDASNNNDSNADNTKKSDPPNSNKQNKNITDTLKSVLNPEQSQAMEVMMKMAQLLSQESNDNEENQKKYNNN